MWQLFYHHCCHICTLMVKKIFFIVCLSFYFQNLLFAQEEFVEPPARHLTRIKFTQLTGGVVLLNARFEDCPDTLNFILDTGSGGISLDSTTSLILGFQPEPSDRTIRGIAGIRKVKFLYDRKLVLPGLTVDSLDFHINDYSVLTTVYGIRIDGIIGYSLLSKFIVHVNYDSLYLDIFSQGSIRYPRGGYHLNPIISTLPIQTLRVKDENTITSRFLYDMGAGLCLLLTSDFVDDSALIKPKRKRFAKQAEGLGGAVDMQLTVIKEVKIGPYRFRNIPTYIFDDEYNVTSYPYLGGILGNDLLRRFNVYMNYAKKDFYIIPNSHYNDLFDYSYAGMELYYIEGLIVVGDIAKDSPAEKSGVKEGDIVIGINNMFNQNFQDYKTALQKAGQKIKILVMRNEELLEFEFKTQSIL